ncbi:MAG: PAS domain-containing protein, partial [Campylobacteraceae bacterium]|nr:PAS domain-containing protein [Campylobacteraceae bacterium]
IELALAPEGIIRQVAPLLGNEKALGLNLFEDKMQKKESFLARDTGKLTLAGPLTLVQGGVALVGRLPIFIDKENKDNFWGFVVTVIEISKIFDSLSWHQLKDEGLSYEVWRINPDTNQKQSILTCDEHILQSPVNYSFEVPNAIWTISMAPTNGWGNSFSFLLREIFALIFSLMLAHMVKLLMELKIAKGFLESEVIQTTDEKFLLQKQLEVLLNAIPDLIWLKDNNGLYLFCNQAFEKLYGAKESDIIGKSDYDFVSEQQADFFRANDLVAMNAKFSISNEEELEFKDNGYQGYFETIKTALYDVNNSLIGVLGIARDITKRKESEERIQKLEYFDALTGLPNKMLLNLRIAHDLSIAHRKNEKLAIFF